MTRARSIFAVAATLAAFALLAPPADAGLRIPFDIVINDYGGGAGYAYGALLDARASADPDAYIGCELWFQTGSTAPMAWCEARTGSQSRACTTTDPSMVSVVRAMTRNSMLQFRYDASGRCGFIYVNNMSYAGVGQSDRAAW